MPSARFWCGVIPRDTLRLEESLAFFKSLWGQGYLCYLQWSPEKGCKTGYLHWQLYAQFTQPVGLFHLQAMFGDFHWDICNGSIESNMTYCGPEGECHECTGSRDNAPVHKFQCGNYDNRLCEVGSIGIAVTQGYRSDLDSALERIAGADSLREVYLNPLLRSTVFKNMKWAEKIYDFTHEVKMPVVVPEDQKWHEPILSLLAKEPDLRFVYLVIGPPMSRKTEFQRFIQNKFRVCIGSTENHKYTKFSYSNEKIILYNWPNGTVPYLRGIEEIVDGGLVSVNHGCTKQKAICAHILMFANFLPSKIWKGRKRIKVLFTFGEPKFLDLEDIDYECPIFDDFIK